MPAAKLKRPRETMVVNRSRSRYPENTLHVRVVWRQAESWCYTIARSRAERNRHAWEHYVPAGLDANGTRFKVKLTGKGRRTAVIVVPFRDGEGVRQVVRRR